VDNSGNWDLVFDGIEDIGFAYAIDTNNDLDLERNGNAVIWALDTDAMAGLDTNADNVPDGNIDANDYDPVNGSVNAVAGNLGTQVALRDIRAVRIWLLARSERVFNDLVDNNTYALGHKMLDMSQPANAGRQNFRHLLFSGTVSLFNFERLP
jgi:type IV pilus assembly protein PilW